MFELKPPSAQIQTASLVAEAWSRARVSFLAEASINDIIVSIDCRLLDRLDDIVRIHSFVAKRRSRSLALVVEV
jgi:hypothetical protein